MQTFKDLRKLAGLLFGQPVRISTVDPMDTALNLLHERQTNLRWEIFICSITGRCHQLAVELMEVNKAIRHLQTLRAEEAPAF